MSSKYRRLLVVVKKIGRVPVCKYTLTLLVKKIAPLFIGEPILFCARLQVPLFSSSPFSKGGLAKLEVRVLLPASHADNRMLSQVCGNGVR
jgi:hypothetical protein